MINFDYQKKNLKKNVMLSLKNGKKNLQIEKKKDGRKKKHLTQS